MMTREKGNKKVARLVMVLGLLVSLYAVPVALRGEATVAMPVAARELGK